MGAVAVTVEQMPRTIKLHQVAWGLALSALSAVLSVAAFKLQPGPARTGRGEPLYYWLMSDAAWASWIFLLGGAAAAATLILIVPPLVRLILRRWLRRAVSATAWLLVLAASGLWLLHAFGFLFSSAVWEFFPVTSEDGQTVIVAWDTLSGAERATVYVHDEGLRYTGVTEGVGELYESIDMIREDCTLEPKPDSFILACGDGSAMIRK